MECFKLNYTLNISWHIATLQSQDSIVCIVTRLWVVQQEVVQLPAGVRDFSLLQSTQIGSGAHPASYSWGSNAKVKNEVVWTSAAFDDGCYWLHLCSYCIYSKSLYRVLSEGNKKMHKFCLKNLRKRHHSIESYV